MSSAAPARKDQDSKRGFGSQRCHSRFHSALLGVLRWLRITYALGSIYPGKRLASTSWSWASLKLPSNKQKSCTIDAGVTVYSIPPVLYPPG